MCNNLDCKGEFVEEIHTKEKTVILPCNTDIRKDFLFLLKKLKDNDQKVILETNGRMFSYEGFTEKVKSLVSEVRLLFYSLDPEVHKEMTGVDALNQVIMGYRNMVMSGLNLKVLIAVNRMNMQNLSRTIDYFEDIPVFVKVLDPHPVVHLELDKSKNKAEVSMIPLEVKIEITTQCEKKCEFRYNHNIYNMSEPNMTLSQVKKQIDEIVELGCKRVRFTGGEPALHKDLKEMLKYAKDNSLTTIVNTNKYDVEGFEGLVDYFLFSFNSLENYPQLKKGINKLREYGSKVEICTVATISNIKIMKEYWNLVKDLNAYWFVLRDIPTKKNPVRTSKQDVKLLVDSLLEAKAKTHISGFPICMYEPLKKFSGGTGCGVWNKLVVGVKGVRWCYAENVKGKTIAGAWPPLMKSLLHKTCHECELLEQCGGGCSYICNSVPQNTEEFIAFKKSINRSSTPRVTVVVPTFNRSEILDTTLTALESQEYSDYEIIVVDDGSDDDTRAIVKRHDVRYLWQANKGFRVARARNLGGLNGKGEVVVFLNDDVVALPNLIKHYVNSLQDSHIVCGYTSSYSMNDDYDFEKIRQLVLESINRLYDVKITKEFRHKLFEEKATTKSKEIWGSLVATNFSLWQDVFEKEHFNEIFVGWGVEDEELGYRYYNQGFVMKMDKDCVGLHMPHPGEVLVEIYTEKKVEQIMKNFQRFFKQHPVQKIKDYIIKRYECLPEVFKNEEREKALFEVVNEKTKLTRLDSKFNIAYCLLGRKNYHFFHYLEALIQNFRGDVFVFSSEEEEILKNEIRYIKNPINKFGSSNNMTPRKKLCSMLQKGDYDAIIFFDYGEYNLIKYLRKEIEKSLFIQVFHGTSDKKYIVNSQQNLYDLILVPGQRDYLRCSNKNKVKKVGYPKFDKFIRTNNLVSKLKKRLCIESNRKVVLYAPTWDNYIYPPFPLFSSFKYLIPHLYKKRYKDFVLIVKPHPNLFKYNMGIVKHSKKMFSEISNVIFLDEHWIIDSVDLMSISDLLITDISSVSAEFLFFDKPIIFFDHPDIADLKEEKYIWVCGDQVSNVTQLFKYIYMNLNYPNRYQSIRKKMFDEYFDMIDGKSTERAINEIGKAIINKKYQKKNFGRIGHFLGSRCKGGAFQILSLTPNLLKAIAEKGYENIIYTNNKEIYCFLKCKKQFFFLKIKFVESLNQVLIHSFANKIRAIVFYDYLGDFLQIDSSLKDSFNSVKKIQVFHGTSDKNIIMDPEERIFDLFLVPGEKDYKRLTYKNKVKMVGPINLDNHKDKFENLSEIKANLRLKKNRKILLYAPTWDNFFVNSNLSSITYINFAQLNVFLKDYYVLIKPHPSTFIYDKNLIDKIKETTSKNLVLIYPDSNININQLFAISDILITDVSSISTSFLVYNKPIIFYDHPGLKGLKDEKKMWSCGDVVSSTRDLVDKIYINLKRPEKYNQQRKEKLKQYFIKLDGRAAERAANYIVELLDEHNIKKRFDN